MGQRDLDYGQWESHAIGHARQNEFAATALTDCASLSQGKER